MVAVGLWWLPALAVQLAGPARLEPLGVQAELTGVRPQGLLGFHIASMTLQERSQPLRLGDVSARLDWLGWSLDGRIGDGHFELRSRHDARLGLAYFQRLPIEPLLGFVEGSLPPLRARGDASGALRWSQGVELSAHLVDAQLDLPILGLLDLASVDLLLALAEDGSADIARLAASGEVGELEAVGTVRPSGELALEVNLLRLEPRLVALVERLRADLLPLPATLEIRGRFPSLEVRRIDASARLADSPSPLETQLPGE